MDLPDSVTTLCLARVASIAPGEAWTQWSLSPVVLAALACVAVLGARHLAALPADARPGAAASLLAALVLLLVALVSPLCRLASVLAAAHMIQHLLLVAAAPALLALSVPPTAADAPPASPARLAAATAFYGGVIWISHMPKLYEEALRDGALHVAQIAVLVSTGVAFWRAILTSARQSDGMAGLAVLALLVTVLHTGLLGALLTFSPVLWYPTVTTAAPAWGLTPLEDQQIAGLIMWVPMGAILGAAALVVIEARLGRAHRAALGPRSS